MPRLLSDILGSLSGQQCEFAVLGVLCTNSRTIQPRLQPLRLALNDKTALGALQLQGNFT
jgi:hypothetical protein